MATFGKTDIGGSNQSTGGIEYLIVCKYTMPENGTITKITAYIRNSGATNGKAAIYSDNAGAPNVKHAESNEVSIGAGYSWVDFTISHVNNAGSVPLWLGVCVDDGWQQKYDAGAANQQAYKEVVYPAYPDPYGAPDGYQAFAFSIYATYTPSAEVTPLGNIAQLATQMHILIHKQLPKLNPFKNRFQNFVPRIVT